MASELIIIIINKNKDIAYFHCGDDGNEPGWDQLSTSPLVSNHPQCFHVYDDRVGSLMNNEQITVVATESGQKMDVVVFSKRVDMIKVVIGEGVHSVTCELTPTGNGQAYAGSVMGREIVYQHSRDQVQADIDKANPELRKSNRRR